MHLRGFFFFFSTSDTCVLKIYIFGKDDNLKYIYFEKQYNQMFALDVHFISSTNNTLCMQLTCATTSDVVHI